MIKKEDYFVDLKETQSLCELLLQTSHYEKLGRAGIFAIIQTAKSLGIDPRLAIGGGLYFVKGKVEMSSRMMAALIRAKKHSITRDSKSDDTICILHGKRSDTNDCWTESFSMEEAKKAGLLIKKLDKNTGREIDGPWNLFPRDMLYARALSRLARQLFPDVIGNCYVENEIALDPNIKEEPTQVPSQPEIIDSGAKEGLSKLFEEIGPEQEKFLKWAGIKTLSELTTDKLDAAKNVLSSIKRGILLKKERENDVTNTAIARMA